MNVAVLSIFLLSLCLYRAESSIIDDRDNVWNLGRVPLITEWEGEHISEVVEDLCPEFQKLLQKTLDFYHRGKIDKATKMFHRILEDSADHPDILCEYGTFLEQTNTKNVSEAFHYYIYSIHKGYNQQKAIQNYLRILPKVKNFEKNLFDVLDHQDAKLEAIDLGNDVALEKIHSVQQQKRVEHVFHTNAVEGNTLSFEVAKYIIENGKAPSGTFHAREVNEIWGTLEAFDYSSFVALADYIEFLELENEEPFVTLELDAHHGLLSLPPIVRDQVHHEGLLESANEHNEHLLFISQVNKMILGNVMPDDAGVFRKRDVSVGGYVPPHYTEVPLLMEKFGQWLYETEKSGVLHTVERAALAHYQLTWIHPFQDGNGRTARILMNTIMMSKGYPPVMIKLEDRENYYDALRKTQKSGDTRPFIYFIYQMALRSVEEYVQELQHLFREEVQFVPEFEPSSVPTWYISK